MYDITDIKHYSVYLDLDRFLVHLLLLFLLLRVKIYRVLFFNLS